MWKKVIAFFCLVLAAALAGMFHIQRQQSANKAQELRNLNAVIQQLQSEKSELEQELEELTGETDARETEKATGVLCFTSIDQNLYTQAYSKLQKNGYTGLFIMQNRKLPGDYNTISVEEFLELLDAGWSYGISLPKAENMEEDWQTSVQEYLQELDIRTGVLPSVYYFEVGEYSAVSVSFLKECGIDTVLYCGKEQAEPTEGITQIPLYGYLTEPAELDVDVPLGLEVQIAWDEDSDSSLRYTVDDLSSVLEQNTVAINDLASLQQLSQQQAEQEAQFQLNAAKISALQARISAIDDEIKQLYH